MNVIRVSVVATILLVSFSARVAYAAGRASDITVLRSDERGVVFDYTPPEAVLTQADGFDGMWLYVPGADYIGSPGEPAVPVRIVPVALPPSATATATLIDASWSKRGDDRLAPVPTVVGDSRESLRDVLVADGRAYRSDIEYPASAVSVLTTRPVRGTNLAYVVVAAARHNPARRSTEILRSATVAVTFTGGSDTRSDVPQGPLDRLVVSTVVNSDVAESFVGAMLDPTALAEFTQTDPFAPASDWYVAKVIETGITEITQEDLAGAGMPVGSVDPRTLRVFTSDQSPVVYDNSVDRPRLEECAIRVVGEDDGSFDPGDALVFYAQATDRYVLDNDSTVSYRIHPYADSTTYWITYNGSFGYNPLRMSTLYGGGSGGAVNTVTRRAHHEIEALLPYNTSSEITDYHHWYESLTGGTSVFPSTPGGVGSVDTLIVSSRSQIGNGYAHVAVNGSAATYLGYDTPTPDFRTRVSTSSLVDGTNSVSFAFSRSASYMDSIDVFFNYVDIVYRASASAVDGVAVFEKPYELSGTLRYNASGFSSAPEAYVVTDQLDVRWVTGGSYSGGTLSFTDPDANGPRWYEVAEPTSRNEVAAVRSASLSHLRDPNLADNRADCLIITPSEFAAEAEQLAVHRESHGLTARVVMVDEIYDEFAFGQRDASAIKDFCRYTFEYWRDASHAPPSFVCLFGDGHYDHRRREASSGPSYIPPYTDVAGGYLAEISDEWYVLFAGPREYDTDSNGVADMVIGRLNVNSTSQAQAVVDKIVGYESDPEWGPWRNSVCYIADDEYGSGDTERQHTDQSETLDRLCTPPRIERLKVYLMEYPFDALGEKPGARDAIIEDWDDGAMIVNFIGHGNKDVWAHEHVFRRAVDIPRLQQSPRLPMVYTASCSIGYFDHPTATGMAEELVVEEGKGAIGSISATRAVYSSGNAALNQAYFNALFSGTRPTLGEALFIAKMQYPSSNSTRFTVLGDPALDLAVPVYDVAITDVSPDTLRALEPVTVTGEVQSDSVLVADFDGTVTLRAFDGLRERTHYMPDGQGVSYNLPGRPIFRGPAQVAGGRFSMTFIVPKDISYGDETARLIAYVEDGETDGSGALDGLVLGGDVTVQIDTVGPQIEIGFAGQDFASGDPVGSSPVLSAVCSDPVGINITGAFGHEIMLTVDGDETNAVDATDDFVYDMGSYTRGAVTRELDWLEPGVHTLSLKVWDNANNSSVADATIEIAAAGSFFVRELLNYPNPFARTTTFTYVLSDAAAEVRLMLFTVAGRLVRTLVGSGASGYNQIYWNGRDDDGDLVGNGVYIVKIAATSVSDESAEAFAKAVVVH
jgi:hypothetical protein